ncbi:Ubiquinone biosynthesis protein UbiJ [hydrothermal vent metagenome]|uniref:Ubiquinone biosynthesis protein UbiJ n=1 Tax=hydrothermal vent metagenome TaxID=652676 RepID=A0A3B0WTH8_9ZZZZ
MNTSTNPASFSLLSLSKAIESALNIAIRLDDEQGEAFKPLENKVINLTLTPIKSPLYIIVTNAMMSVQTTLQGEADAAIQTTLIDFASLPIQRELSRAKLSGDTELAQHFIKALCTLDIDWEEQLSHCTGDLIAFKVGHGIRALLKTKKTVKENVSKTLKEYLQFEIEAVPTKSQVNHFCQNVDVLKNDLMALETRIHKLVATQAPSQTHFNS